MSRSLQQNISANHRMKVIALLFLVAAFTAIKAADMIETIEFRTSDCEDCGMTFTGTVSLKVS